MDQCWPEQGRQPWPEPPPGARWANRRIPGSEAYGLLQLKQLGPTPYLGANQAERIDAAVAQVCRPLQQVPGT